MFHIGTCFSKVSFVRYKTRSIGHLTTIEFNNNSVLIQLANHYPISGAPLKTRESPRGIVVNMLNRDIVLS